MHTQIDWCWCAECGTRYVEPEVPDGCYRYIHPDCLCGEDAKTVVVQYPIHDECENITIDCVRMEG